MNKKLKKYLDDGERMEKRIQEMQEQLKAVRSAQELEENKEIVRRFRDMKLSGRELFSLLCGMQDGSVTFQKAEDGKGTFGEMEDAAGENDGTGGVDAGKEAQDPLPENQVGNSEKEDMDHETEMDENA